MSRVVDKLIAAGVDIKFNKSDLIEMLVLEKEEQLSAQLAAEVDKENGVMRRLKNTMNKFVDAREEGVNKRLEPVLVALKQAGIKYDDVSMQFGSKFDCTEDVRYILADTIKNSRQIDEDRVSIAVDKPHGYGNVLDTTITVPIKAAERRLLNTGIRLATEMLELRASSKELRKEVDELSGVGKRAKVKLMKDFLNGTEQGKELVKAMGAVKMLGA